jgi:type VI secretion system secreted protein VgrG
MTQVDNTMLRVAQSWAGKGWGTYFWPRAGDEVLIDFIEGDPDQPIVVGSVYNGVNMPKYSPNRPQYTLSGILTRSSKDGGAANANELRFEDLKGKEQIFMNAEREYDLHVENTWHTLVGSEQHTTIGANRFEEIGKNFEQTIGKSEVRKIGAGMDTTVADDQRLVVGGNVEETIGVDHKSVIGDSFEMITGNHHIIQVGSDHRMETAGNCTTKAGITWSADASENAYLSAGSNIVIQSDQQICLSGPGGFISIGPAGITIQGTMVMINSGGVPIPIIPVFPPTKGKDPRSTVDPTKPSFPGDVPPSKR